MRVAVIPVGYSNGYPAYQSNSGHVLIQGRKAPITYLINMNLLWWTSRTSPVSRSATRWSCWVSRTTIPFVRESFTNYTQLINNEMLSRLPMAISSANCEIIEYVRLRLRSEAVISEKIVCFWDRLNCTCGYSSKVGQPCTPYMPEGCHWLAVHTSSALPA